MLHQPVEAAHVPRKPTLLSRVVRRIILWVYAWKGWRIEGSLPRHLRKYVIAGAPHTSNWDFVFFAGATHRENIRPNFMGKHTLFTGAMRNFMLDMGGIPVDRTKKANATQQVAEEFARRDELALVIACEGTRKSDGRWKSGFYHIAQAAGVPIVPAYADNERMIIGFGEPLVPSGNYGEDLLKLAEWFRSKLPDYERFKVMEAQARAIIEGRNDV
ncbi:lysophospholipid acyltransferase family protein [Erythrobacter sp. HL-111]|uniref:lysophospholipid acyltransferase family protein n=1 Tax=Erythrobacter sp. HL-111 TaxID=1798193 RepID=UPI0006D9D76A|nr:lysophospholipid acyltransferase family protein [Erythrobacter sp. HL-111]KPP94801.1 MAG: 1-acyl-sn-glycerol-3-phosphate acyltransferase [Erythrobacteraceae bacterium HL-111]SDS85789.1 1-acyl-sn-glycerol-3-phosphate acyltransferases [Erythrobacter sp. HL-111]